MVQIPVKVFGFAFFIVWEGVVAYQFSVVYNT